ncbi:MAG: PEP-CTERM sorting domain-containing protein [Bryobacteraceae bacterium]|nr:PEP-CTERM sorting domain-containing protein [Bryobacteraceae bacterium]
MTRLAKPGLLLLLAAFVCPAASVDTTVYWDGFSTVTPFGKPSTSTYGQTFTSFGGILTSFTFWLSNNFNGPEVRFGAYLMRWDVANERATGSVLYQSAMQSGTAQSTPTAYTFNTNLSIASGAYIAFLTTAPFAGQMPSANAVLDMGHLAVDIYGGGSFYYQNNTASNLSSLTTAPWESFGGGEDAAFMVEIVPEPGAFVLAGGGLLALYFLRRRSA